MKLVIHYNTEATNGVMYTTLNEHVGGHPINDNLITTNTNPTAQLPKKSTLKHLPAPLACRPLWLFALFDDTICFATFSDAAFQSIHAWCICTTNAWPSGEIVVAFPPNACGSTTGVSVPFGVKWV
jgi:hypothetical protein